MLKYKMQSVQKREEIFKNVFKVLSSMKDVFLFLSVPPGSTPHMMIDVVVIEILFRNLVWCKLYKELNISVLESKCCLTLFMCFAGMLL